MAGVQAAAPLLFTVEFRRKMAQLPLEDRKEWLASLAARVREAPPSSGLAQEMREVARGCRLPLVDSIQAQLGPFDPALLRAVLEVPREQFVRLDDLERSADDTPLPLDDQGHATISAPHAYLLSYRLLELAPGDPLVELGSGSGYGAALAAFIVGPQGRVRSFEIDRRLAAWAGRNLEGTTNVSVIHADATGSAPSWEGVRKVVVTYAVKDIPAAWAEALPEGGRLVAPVGQRDHDQLLVMLRRIEGRVLRTEHGAVRYVADRSGR
jgi:protein-L-isoaspartate(D-aspartate) O-methyltransferase